MPSASTSRVASPTPTPGRSRAIVRRWWPHSRPFGGSDGSYCSGVQSAADAEVTFSKPRGITPTTV